MLLQIRTIKNTLKNTVVAAILAPLFFTFPTHATAANFPRNCNIVQDTTGKAERERSAREVMKNVQPGADAPRFTLKSADGTQFSLTDVKDKYIVLDFWGSWCGPCMMGMPKMKEYYAKYKDKVEFIGIACNETEQKWLETIEKERLPWKNVMDNKTPGTRVSTEYFVIGHPTKVIIDRDYRIVEVFIGEGEDFYERLDELLK